jgi:hypothetical protein
MYYGIYDILKNFSYLYPLTSVILISTIYVTFITVLNVIFQFTLVLAAAEAAADASGVGMGISFRVPLPS